MFPTAKTLLGVLFLLLLGHDILSQDLCSAGDDPFFLSPARTFCTDSAGTANISFSIRHEQGIGEYIVSFPDGTDTTYKNITENIEIERDFIFDCNNISGTPRSPTELDPYYEYSDGFTVVRTDCVDDQGSTKKSSFTARIIPNPLRAIDISNLTCRSAPYIVDVTALVCSPELIDTYKWFLDGKELMGETEASIKKYVISKPGDYVFKVAVTTLSDGCDYYIERPITITAAPSITIDYVLDSSDLCSPVVEFVAMASASNADAIQWFTSSPAVTFLSPDSASTIIRINNEMPGSHRILATAISTDCPNATDDFTIETFNGQTITPRRPLTTCSDVPFAICESLDYAPEPVSIIWTAADASVSFEDANSVCPKPTFSNSGTFVLLATGQDVCGLPFSISIPVNVTNGDPLTIDRAAIDTVCASAAQVQLLDFISPADNVRSITGPGVIGSSFNPSGLTGEVVLQIVDSCGTQYNLPIYVREEGVFSGGNPVVCQGSSLDLNTLQSGVYSGTGVVNSIFRSDGLSPGTYPVSYVSDAFCGGSGSFTVTVEEPSTAGFSIVATEACVGVDSTNLANLFPINTALEIVNTSLSSVRSYEVLGRTDSIRDQETTTLSFDSPGMYTIRQIVGPADGVCRDTSEKIIEVFAPLDLRTAVEIDSSGCDSLTLSFSVAGVNDRLNFQWAFSSGDSSMAVNPELTVARPVSAGIFRATVAIGNGCFVQQDTLYIEPPRRFQVAFGILNDNNTICSGETALLVNNSVNASNFLVTFPDGTTRTQLPDSLVLTNDTEEVLEYILRLDGESSNCPSQFAIDTIFVLPVTTRASFRLDFTDDCSPAEVELINLASPGATSLVNWGDGSTDQPVTDLNTLRYVYRVERDTTFTITMVTSRCGVDTFRRTFTARAGAEADFTTATPGVRCAGQALQFLPNRLNQAGSYKWLFGDGDSSLVVQPGHVFAARGTYEVSLRVTNDNGCTATDTASVTINDYDGLPLEATFPRTVCVDAPFTVLVNGDGSGLTYDYDSLRVDQPLERPYRKEGDFKFVLTATDANGCQVDTSATVSVFPAFTVAIQPDEPVLSIEFGEPLQLSFRMDPLRLLDSIRWVGDSLDSPGTQITVANPTGDGIYTVSVTDEYGCLATDSVRVNVSRNYDELIYVPNAFSPNGDGINETFGIDARSNTVRSLRAMRVFSRWGESLFECTDCPLGNAGNGWDGELGGRPLKPGIYVWTAEVEFRDGQRQIFRGTVALVR